jgi:ribose transport system permease protein
MKSLLRNTERYRSPVILILIVLFAIFAHPKFLTNTNLLNLLMQISVNGIVAVGMTLVIITGGFDLSVGSVMAMTGVVVMKVLPMGIVPAISAGLIVGIIVGCINGGLIAYVGINPFIATLGAMAFVRGLALGLTDSRPVSGANADFITIGLSFWPMAFFALLIVAMEYYIRRTRSGHNIYVYGSNKEAGFLAGINMRKTLFVTYVLCSVTASVAGIFLSARLGTGSPVIAEDAALLAIAAVILGGTSLTGGSGSVLRTLTGILILGVLTNIMNLIGVTSYLQIVIKGLLVVAVVAFDAPALKRLQRRART